MAHAIPEKLCAEISKIRSEAAAELSKKITEHLAELNFLDVRFEIQLEKLEHYSANGYDETEYLIAVNVGESLKPLAKVASGGEMSRVMLALKSHLFINKKLSRIYCFPSVLIKVGNIS